MSRTTVPIDRTGSGRPEREDARHSSLSWRAKLLLALVALMSPVALVGLTELGIRLSGIDTELVPSQNVEIAIPAWLMADENFASGLQPGVKAAQVAWLRNFTEARYIWTKLKPNVDVHALNPYDEFGLAKGVTFHFSSNGDGFRGRAFEPKRPGVIRIVCIGDSSTFGWGVDDEYTYPTLLEARVHRAGGPDVEVFNLGIPGFTSRHGLGVLRHYALDLEPDIFVFSFGANDARRVLRPVDGVLSQDDGWRGTVRFAALRLRTYQLVRKMVFALSDPTARRVDEQELVPAVSDTQYVANLKAMARIARAHGGRSVFLAVCAQPPMVQQMRDVAEAIQAPMVDAFTLFVQHVDDLKAHRQYADEVRHYENIYGRETMEKQWRLYVTTDGCHPNRAGMSLIADALAEAIGEPGRTR